MSDIPKSRFTEYMVRENDLDQHGFREWVFVPAMLFGSEDKWWGDRGKRTSPHEGLDFCLYSDSSRNLLRLEAGTRIPATHDGTVVAIIDDFLAKSIVLEHRLPDHGSTVLTIYGHVVPRETLRVGSIVDEAEIIGVLAIRSKSSVRVYPHLHVSLALPSKVASYDTLTWRHLSNPELFDMIDPLSLMVGPYRVIQQIKEDPTEP